MRHDLINIKAKTKTRQDNDDNDTERTPWKSDTRDLWCSRHWSHVWQLRTTIITFIVTLQLKVTGGSIRNTCDVFFYLKMGKMTVKLWLLKQINYHPLLILRCNVIELGGQINCLTKNKSNIVTDKKYGCPWGGVRGGGGLWTNARHFDVLKKRGVQCMGRESLPGIQNNWKRNCLSRYEQDIFGFATDTKISDLLCQAFHLFPSQPGCHCQLGKYQSGLRYRPISCNSPRDIFWSSPSAKDFKQNLPMLGFKADICQSWILPGW